MLTPSRSTLKPARIPQAAVARIPEANEILIGTHTRIASELWDALMAQRPRLHPADLLIREVFDAEYVLQMIEAGFRVYEAALPPDDQIFLDRELGYRLPNWEPLPDAFAQASRLSWTRLGYYTCLAGTVTIITETGLMKVVERDHLWFSVKQVEPLPNVGERVTILANRPFLDVETPLLDVITIWQDRENDLSDRSQSG